MTKERNPRRKKQLDYERQHFSPGKHDKGFRKQWPKKKASEQRAARHAVTQALITATAESAETVEQAVARVHRHPVRKWATFNLQEYRAFKMRNRMQRIGRKQLAKTR